MGRIATQTLFETSAHKPSWRSYAVSLGVHIGMVGLAFAVVVPMAIEVHKTYRHITLIGPLVDYKPTHPLRAPKLIVHAAIRPAPKTFVPPPVVVPTRKPAQIQIEKAPEMKVVQSPPEFKVELPAAPKALIQTSAFQQSKELAKAAPTQTVRVGGFGDPSGVRPSEASRNSPVTLAKVGAFDLPDNTGHKGGGGAQSDGTIRQTEFGGTVGPGRPKTSAGNDAIRATAFGDATLVPPPSARKTDTGGGGFTPVEILFKPKPAYTVEARGMRLEGEVSLQVIFQASGTIRVVRVVRGLGHGLDEAAQQAAQRVRFKPAMRGGVPVDTNATIKISFELT
jgi:TonB family protein